MCKIAHAITRKATELAKAMRAAKKGKKSYDEAAAQRKVKVEEMQAATKAKAAKKREEAGEPPLEEEPATEELAEDP